MPALLGYALANNCHPTPLADTARQVLAALQATGQLAPTARVALCSQLCLVEAHRGQGLMPALLAQLHRQLASRYDYLYASVHRLNARSLAFHLREGYAPVAEKDERVHLLRVIGGTGARPTLPPGCELRPGRATDAPALCDLNQPWLRPTRTGRFADGFLTTGYTPAEYAAGDVSVLAEPCLADDGNTLAFLNPLLRDLT